MEVNQNKKAIELPTNVPVNIDFENMLKRFIHDVKKWEIIEEVRSRRYFIKPSALKREKAKKLLRKK